MAKVPTRSSLASFAWGLALGMTMMFILEHSYKMYHIHEFIRSRPATKSVADSIISRPSINPVDRSSNSIKVGAGSNLNNLSSTPKKEANRSRILCWIMTSPEYLPVRAKSAKDTWGKRCDVLLFFSSKADANFPAIGLNVEEGLGKLWYKTRAAMDYLHEHHLNDADWFVKADDDTYMIIENLRHMLSKLSSSDPHYIGRYFTHYQGYNSGGAGYIFSRETLRRMKKALGEPSCPKDHQFEDVAVGICLKAQGVRPVSTRDSSDRETFMPFTPEMHLTPPNVGHAPDWIRHYSYPLPYKDGPECCSDYPISFHAIVPARMYTIEYLVYRVKYRQ